AYLRLAAATGAFDEARSLVTRWVAPEAVDDSGFRSLCMAILDEAQGKGSAAAALRRAAHPHGAPFPHARPAAEIACRRLAALAEKAGRADEAARYRRWAQAMRFL